MFTLDESQQKKLREWQEQLVPNVYAYAGAIGGRFTYSFTPTGVGVIVVVSDSMSKTEIDLTDYEGF